MKMTYVYIALVVALIVGVVYVRNQSSYVSPEVTTKFDGFAQCLTDAGAKFYGAFWCPHCQAQKKLLQNSKNIPYVECSTPDRKAQTPECIEKKIEGYPTWIFADGSRGDGEQTLEQLSTKTGCELPTT